MSDILTCLKQGVPHTYRLPWQSFTDLLRTRGSERGVQVAIIFRDVDSDHREVVTYADLDARTAQMAVSLHHDYDIQPGDCVSLALPNCIEIPLITLALFRLGATSVPLDLKRDPPDRKRFKVMDLSLIHI